jgi:tetratricopeptide (TPR) repeat protein
MVMGERHRIFIATLLYAQGDYGGARPLYERALTISEKVLGAEHPYTAVSLSNLAGLLQGLGDHDGSRPLYERALAISEKVLGAEHPDTKNSASGAADVLDALGRADEAAALRACFGLVREAPGSASRENMLINFSVRLFDGQIIAQRANSCLIFSLNIAIVLNRR